MKKIPTLFVREFDERTHKIIFVHDVITPGCEEAFLHGTATVKYDGACCCFIGGDLYRRFDAKPGRTAPYGSIPCQESPDPVTGHWPHWYKCETSDPACKWYFEAMKQYIIAGGEIPKSADPVTFEAIGKHFNGNPYYMQGDTLIKHGSVPAVVSRDFESVKIWLNDHFAEGLVFWLDGQPVCKIKKTDFGMKWGAKKNAAD